MEGIRGEQRKAVDELAARLKRRLLRGDFSGWENDDPESEPRFFRLVRICYRHRLARPGMAVWTLAAAPRAAREQALDRDGHMGDLVRHAAAVALAWQVRVAGRSWGAPDDAEIFAVRRAPRRRRAAA